MGPSSAARTVVAAAVLMASTLSVHAAGAAAQTNRPALALADATASPGASPDPAPAPSPTASASPTPSPVPGPSGSPAPTASPSPSPSASASAVPSPSATAPATPTPPPVGGQALPAPGPSVAVLGSDAIQLSGLRSITVRTLATPSGPTRVIELIADGTTLTGLSLQAPCGAHSRVSTMAAQERMTGGLTLDATVLQATIAGIPIVAAAADLPEGQLALPGITLPPLPADVSFRTVRLFALTIQSGAMSLTGAQMTTAAC